ncbi:DUF3278 domain-containing protein [Macrococcus equipercicus]|uniref:DUF3278 domain-containing protein n=1 Tax=Macrococcus equipercicus TaxID=69967 RepID=A0A9Q9BNR0_9STAP|nr:DUF3278 domain-containing protein [Macrococcus equipercicus]UTH13875.1 DUF3278 domain-containing protein [Macrococcus equipercicus]
MNHLMDKILPVFVGLETERDEYMRLQGRKIMAYCHVYSFAIVSIAMMISLIADLYFDMISIGTLLLFVIQQIVAIYTLIKSKKMNLDTDEVYSKIEYKEKLKTLRFQALKIGILWGTTMFVWMELVFPHLSGESSNLAIDGVYRWALGGLFFGTIMYFVAKSKIIKEYD